MQWGWNGELGLGVSVQLGGKGAWNSSPASIKTAPLFIFFLVFLIAETEF